MIRQPPRSTLFPTTTLSRSQATWDAAQVVLARNKERAVRNNRHTEEFLLRAGFLRCASCGRTMHCRHKRGRSEEHTSELQSRQYLVCRLLLEKKKNTQRMHT